MGHFEGTHTELLGWQVTNRETGETIPIERDVTHRHPAWVLNQCECETESDLQETIDQYDADDFLAVGNSPDIYGVSAILREVTDAVEVHVEWSFLGEPTGKGKSGWISSVEDLARLLPTGDGWGAKIHMTHRAAEFLGAYETEWGWAINTPELRCALEVAD